MKLLLLLLSLSACSAQVTSGLPRFLVFDYPTNEVIAATTAAHILTATNVALPLSNWNSYATLTNLHASNAVAIWLDGPRMFFAVKASNEWGEVFSDVLTSSPPVAGHNVRIQ